MYNIIKTIERGSFTEVKYLEKLIHHILHRELRSGLAYNCLFSEHILNPKLNKIKIAESSFELFGCMGIAFISPNFSALVGNGLTEGTVLCCGGEVTTVGSYVDGNLVKGSDFRNNFGGEDINEYLKRNICCKNYPFSLSSDIELIRDIKNKNCSLNFDMNKNKNKNLKYQLPDESFVELEDFDYNAPEILFKPYKANYEFGGIHELVLNSLEFSGNRNEVKNVILSGGTTKTKGFTNRLKFEIEKKTQQKFKFFEDKEEYQYSSFKGMSIIAESKNLLKNIFISPETYNEEGPRCFFNLEER